MKMRIQIISLIIFLVLLGSEVRSQSVPQLTLGCPESELPQQGFFGINSEGIIKAAIKVDPTLIKGAENINIVAFDFGLASKINVASATLWATYELNEEPFISQLTEAKIQKGWNHVALPQAVEVEMRPFYVGYTLECTGTSYPVAVVGNKGEADCFVDLGNGWEKVSSTESGILALSVTIQGNNLPLYDLSIISAQVPPRIHTTEPTLIPIEVRNAGSLPITGFTIESLEDENFVQEYEFNEVIEPNHRKVVELEFTPISPQSETPILLTLTISKLVDGIDCNTSDNIFSSYAIISPFLFIKRLLVEEFTTMLCSNCPRAANLLHQALEKDKYNDRIIAVCHHSGYFTDFLTLPCDEEMLVLYGAGSTFAPAMCFDRLQLNGEEVVAVDVPQYLADLTSIFDSLLERQTDVDFNILAKRNVSSAILDIEVDGTYIPDRMPDTPDHITIYVLENNIPTPIQAGAGEDYMQQHVIRAYNATWGEEVNCDENGHFSYSVALTLPEDINNDNMEVVGVISHYNPDDPLDCAVANSAKALKIDCSDVGQLTVQEAIKTEFFDLLGNRVSERHKGILLKRQTMNDGSIKSVKVIK